MTLTNLVDHARRELAAISEVPEITAGILKIVEAYSELQKAAETTHETIQTINALLEFQHLSPLTDNPDEWYYHDVQPEPFWQNIRNGGAFSHDGGKTYYLLEEGANDLNRQPLHTSREHTAPAFIQEQLLQEVRSG